MLHKQLYFVIYFIDQYVFSLLQRYFCRFLVPSRDHYIAVVKPVKSFYWRGLFMTLGDDSQCFERLKVNKVLVAAASELVDDTKTVDEILFGFEDPIFGALAKRLKDRQLIDADDEIADVLENLVYGIFKSKNETSGAEEFRVRNGNGNDCGACGDTNCILKVAEILTWQNKT